MNRKPFVVTSCDCAARRHCYPRNSSTWSASRETLNQIFANLHLDHTIWVQDAMDYFSPWSKSMIFFYDDDNCKKRGRHPSLHTSIYVKSSSFSEEQINPLSTSRNSCLVADGRSRSYNSKLLYCMTRSYRYMHAHTPCHGVNRTTWHQELSCCHSTRCLTVVSHNKKIDRDADA